MTTANILDLEGKQSSTIELPEIFGLAYKPWLIQRAVLAEQSLRFQPQAHYVLAGLQTTATYYGAMHAYRSGRHMGIAIRPKQKLGGGVQGEVRRIPSAVKGRRAHPHLIEKRIHEQINRKEYQSALASAIAATSSPSGVAGQNRSLPIIVSDSIESIKKTKEMLKVFSVLGFGNALHKSAEPRVRKGLRRSSRQKGYKHTLLLILGKDNGAVKAARNIPGVSACTIKNLTVSKLSPNGKEVVPTIWSESAVKGISAQAQKLSIRNTTV